MQMIGLLTALARNDLFFNSFNSALSLLNDSHARVCVSVTAKRFLNYANSAAPRAPAD
jgi:hypothetical protein